MAGVPGLPGSLRRPPPPGSAASVKSRRHGRARGVPGRR